MLTRKQHALLTFIDDHLAKDGVPPSYDEMKEALGLKSKSGIHRLIKGLEERGFIRRLPHKARALEVLKKPQNMQEIPRSKGGFEPAWSMARLSLECLGLNILNQIKHRILQLAFHSMAKLQLVRQ
jgi:hypothetical protein